MKNKNIIKQWYKAMSHFKGHTGPLVSNMCLKISQRYTNETKNE